MKPAKVYWLWDAIDLSGLRILPNRVMANALYDRGVISISSDVHRVLIEFRCAVLVVGGVGAVQHRLNAIRVFN